MPRRSRGAYLYLQPARFKDGALVEGSSWAIRDGKIFKRTGCAPEDAAGAEKALAGYLANKYIVNRERDRRASDIEIADVLIAYAHDIVPNHSRPEETATRIEALSAFWAGKKLAQVTGRTCRAYAASRPSQASARRELEDFRSAINHHRREGLCNEIVSVVLPERSRPRQRWLSRSEAARLIWAAYRYREIQKGHPTGRRSRLHVARFILVGLYSGSRAGAICGAAFTAGPGQGLLDLDAGVFYRKAPGERETKKRRPPVRLADRLLAHLRRWHQIRPSQTFAVEFNGEPIGRINKAFGRAAHEAKLGTDVTPHVLRHTAATWMMQNGVQLHEAAGFLGMTAETLERVYGHHHPDFQKAAARGVADRNRLA